MADEFIAEANACEDDDKNHGLDSEATLDRLFEFNVEILELSKRTLTMLKRKSDFQNRSHTKEKIL